MSFIYEDKKLLLELLKQAQAQPAAPVAPEVTPDTLSGYEAARKFLFGLQKDLGDVAAPDSGAPVATEGEPNPKLLKSFPKDVRSIGDFLIWAANAKLTWNGKRIAWLPEEIDQEPITQEKQQAWIFQSYPADRNDRSIDRKPKNVTAYADKDALVAYLSYLRDTPDVQTNEVAKFMISSIIGQANSYLKLKGEKPIDTKTPEKPKDSLDPNMIVDILPEVLDPSNPKEGLNSHPYTGYLNARKDELNWLQVSDLKDQSSFLAWLRNRQVKQSVKNNKSGSFETITTGMLDTNSDKCLGIHAIYKRALELKGVAAGDDSFVSGYSRGVALYLEQVVNFGRQLTGPNGQPCAVTTQGTQAAQPAQSNVNSNQSTTYDPNAAQKVVATLPLRVEVLDFNKITEFFAEYQKMNPNADQWGSPAQVAMDDALGFMLPSAAAGRRINLMAGANEVIEWLKPPDPGKSNYMPFLNSLTTVLNMVGGALRDLKLKYADEDSGESMIKNPTWIARINAQIYGSNSIWQTNRNSIDTLKNKVGNVSQISQMRGGNKYYPYKR
jgi:hypothetical protein